MALAYRITTSNGATFGASRLALREREGEECAAIAGIDAETGQTFNLPVSVVAGIAVVDVQSRRDDFEDRPIVGHERKEP